MNENLVLLVLLYMLCPETKSSLVKSPKYVNDFSFLGRKNMFIFFWSGCVMKTFREVTHPNTTLVQARLTLEFWWNLVY